MALPLAFNTSSTSSSSTSFSSTSSSSTSSVARQLDSAIDSNQSGLSLPATPLFGTDGIRGRVGELLTPALMLQVGYWAGKTLQNDRSGVIILGQDSRNSSGKLAAALSVGLTAAGLDVWNLGLCPTPAVAHLTRTTGATGGVMISASHNPPEDNGIKLFGTDGIKLSAALQTQIETQLRQHTTGLDADCLLRWGQQTARPELLNYYSTALKNSLAGNLSGLRIVLDLAWGAAVHLAPQLFRSLGAEVISLHDRPNGDRINVGCGSTNLETLQAEVQAQQADMGFAFDGDADRVMAIDAQGRVLNGDYILYLWGQQLRQTQQLPGNLLVSTVMANLGFEKAWQNSGGTLIRTAVGDQHVQAEMMRRGAMLGGEQSGHIFCPQHGVSGDGLLTALHLAALVKQSGHSLSELRDRSFQTYPQILKNVRVEDPNHRLNWQQQDSLQQAIAQAKASLGDQGRILVRASGTEPVIRIMVEAIDLPLTAYWSEKLAQTFSQFFNLQ
jgi:phosphoglucosamine mutase